MRVIQTIFRLKQEGELIDAGSLLSWLAGSRNVSAKAKRRAGIRGDISSRDALSYLRGIVSIVRSAGYEGLVVVIDEAETILRSRSDVRGKSLNGLRQIADMSPQFPRLLWVVTGTPDFFESRRGVKGLDPLYDRIRFDNEGGFASSRQPQLELKPFDKSRLTKVASRLHRLFPAENRNRINAKVDERFLGLLVDKVSAGFHGDVGVVPRQFLRTLVEVLDKVDEFEAYDPSKAHEFAPAELNDQEQALLSGEPPVEDDDDLVPVQDAW